MGKNAQGRKHETLVFLSQRATTSDLMAAAHTLPVAETRTDPSFLPDEDHCSHEA